MHLLLRTERRLSYEEIATMSSYGFSQFFSFFLFVLNFPMVRVRSMIFPGLFIIAFSFFAFCTEPSAIFDFDIARPVTGLKADTGYVARSWELIRA